MDKPPIDELTEPAPEPVTETASVAVAEGVAKAAIESATLFESASESVSAPVPVSMPVPVPVSMPAPVPVPTDLELPAGFQRPRPGRVIVDYFWASFLGASLALALFGFLILLHATRLWRPETTALFATFGASFLASITLALTRGFTTKARTFGRRVGRAIATSLFGSVLFALLIGAMIALDEATDMRERELSVAMIITAAGLLVLNIVRVRKARKRASLPEVMSDAMFTRSVEARVGAAPYALAGLAGAGLFIWLLATLIALHKNDLFSLRSRYEMSALIGGILVSTIFAAWRGIPIRFRGAIGWGNRIFLPLIFGALIGLVVIFVFAIVDNVAKPGTRSLGYLLTILSLGMIGFGLWKGRDPQSEGIARKTEFAVVATFLLFGSMWPHSAWFRYALGSAEGARSLGEMHSKNGDYEHASVFFQVACEREDVEACATAASMSLSGSGSPISRRRAEELIELACEDANECESLGQSQSSRTAREMLLRRACDLGSKSACRTVHESMLVMRCDNGDGYSCTALANTIANSPGDARFRAAQLWQKACALGDRAACTHSPR